MYNKELIGVDNMGENGALHSGKGPYKELTEDFNTIEEVVEALLRKKDQGERAYCEFNGVFFDSENVSIDYAYILLTGHKKREYEIQEERKLIGAIDRIPEQIKRGRKLIYPSRLQEWAIDVAKEAVSSTNGQVIDNALKIMTAIAENRPLEEVVDLYKKQFYIGDMILRKDIVRSYVMKYSKNGYPFYEITHEGDWTLQETNQVFEIMLYNERDNGTSADFLDVSESKQKVISRFNSFKIEI